MYRFSRILFKNIHTERSGFDANFLNVKTGFQRLDHIIFRGLRTFSLPENRSSMEPVEF